MGTEIYTVDSKEMKPWDELVPDKIKKVLENPGPHDRLLICMEEDICGANNGEQELLCSISGVEYTSSCDFDPEDYDELSLREPEKFFETHATSTYCYDIPELAITKRSTFAFYNKVAKALAVLQVTNRHFLVCVSQEFGAHVMFLTNCDVCARAVDEFSPRATAQPTPQPEPLKWLTDEQYEILALRLELLRRDFEDWCDSESLCYQRKLFENSEKFTTACHDGTLLDSATNPLDYQVLRSQCRSVLGLQGLAYMCDYPAEAEKILNMLKPYLDAVYKLPKPTMEFNVVLEVEANEEDSDNE